MDVKEDEILKGGLNALQCGYQTSWWSWSARRVVMRVLIQVATAYDCRPLASLKNS